MGILSFIKGEEKILGECFVCKKEITKNKIETHGKALSDGACICSICIYQKQLKIDKSATEASLLAKIKANGFVAPNEFVPTKRIPKLIVLFGAAAPITESFLEIDEKRELINIPEVEHGILSMDNRTEHIRKFKDLVDFELLSNGSKLIDGTSLLGAAAGGDVFGGFGAVVGSGVGSEGTTDVCSSLAIKVVFNDLQNPAVYIPFIGDALKTNSKEYAAIYDAAQECLSVLTVILKNNPPFCGRPQNDSNQT